MAPQLTLVERPGGALGPISSESEVEFFCVGRDRWSIYDRRLPAEAPAAFLGRLQRVAGVYAVSFADPDRPRAYTTSLADSRAHFVGGPVSLRPFLCIVD